MALILQDRTKNGSCWAVWKIEESLEELISKSSKQNLLRDNISGMMLAKRKLEFVAVRLLLEILTDGYVEVGYLPTGKPYPVDCDFKISISHTEGYVAVMVHPELDPGIDIEYISPRVMRIQGRFLNQDEISKLDTNNEMMQTLILWSAKESVFKALGEEGVDFREQLLSKPFKLSETGIFAITEKRTPFQYDFNIDYLVHKDFVLTYTIKSNTK